MARNELPREQILMTIKEVSDYLNLSTRTIYKLMEEKDIPVVRIRGSLRFSKSSIVQWVQEKECSQKA